MEKQPFGRRPPTLRDIAVRAGASVSTVSRALRGDQRISARTRQRIVEIAQRLGYRADVAGSLLRASKPRVVGLLCDLSQELHVAYRHEVLQRAEQAGFRVVVESVEGRCPPGAALRRLREFRIQALVVVDPRCLGDAGDPGAPVVVTIPNDRAVTQRVARGDDPTRGRGSTRRAARAVASGLLEADRPW